METQTTRAESNILQALELLGGWSTIKELSTKSGYSSDWTSKTVVDLLDSGVLQKSKLSPHQISLAGKPVVPTLAETTLSLESDFRPLARAAAHTVGNSSFLQKYLTGRISTTISVLTLLKLANLAGYDLVLVRRK